MQSVKEIEEKDLVEEELKVLFKMTFSLEAELEEVIGSKVI